MKLPSLQQIISSNIFESIIFIILSLIAIQILEVIFKKIYIKQGKTIGFTFLKAVLKGFIILSIVIKIFAYSDLFTKFANTILMSSSLLVVVLGFVFQEGLSNIVHGLMITIFKPFDVGNRVQINMCGEIISGYIKSVNLRHTIITGILDNAELIIPNSQLDNSIIKNLSNQNEANRYPIIIGITYKDAQNFDKLQLAKQIMSDAILQNKYTIDEREDKNKNIFVKVDYAESKVTLTAFVSTQSAEDNIIACSEIKEVLLNKFLEHDIHFAYNCLEISGTLNSK